jgi:O-antigen/teichoic acid export membrane protein
MQKSQPDQSSARALLTAPRAAPSVRASPSNPAPAMPRLIAAFQGQSLLARVLRSSGWTILGYGASQGLRLAANLVLARLLFPEAFGLMALVGVVTVGLAMFSDIGVGPSIAQNKRGDDPDFLDTAWTIQVIRGFALWALTALLAGPVAQFYDEPLLALYLPIAGITLAIAGFNPTRIETAQRHLIVGRLTALDLAAQAIGIAAMIALAMILQSALALVLGGIVTAAAKLALTHAGLPGARNRLRWERAAGRELVGFGKWIFLSTAFWFLSLQGDKAILGRFLSLEALGQYNIGYFLASFPVLLGLNVVQRIMLPVYRDKPPGAAPENAANLSRLRFALSTGLLALLAVMAMAGPALVDLLYDARYAPAGAMIVLIACALIPQVIGMTYDQAALAAGDSRGFFVYSGARACLQMTGLLLGVTQFGLVGGIAGLGIGTIGAHFVLIRLARRHRAWDPRHDAVFVALGAALAAGAIALHWDLLRVLASGV